MGLTILIIGSGAREHAILDAYKRSGKVTKIIIAPGNPFMLTEKNEHIDIICESCSLHDPVSILKIAQTYIPDIIEVAQDDALAAGTVDVLQEHKFRVFGPTKAAARIEWDKEWSRAFMQRHHIPIPAFASFNTNNIPAAEKYVEEIYQKDPHAMVFVKATGLCAGKGALKCENIAEAKRNIAEMQSFGNAGKIFLIEEGLVGEEFSCYAICDGKHYQLLTAAQDNKTAYNFDLGPQTGGMGSHAPALVAVDLLNEIDNSMVAPAIQGMQKEGIKYVGVLFIGGIIVKGKPMVIEYNARWGDPESQSIIPSIETNYVDIVNACINGTLHEMSIKQDAFTRVCVVGAAKGYPEKTTKGNIIYNIEETTKHKNNTSVKIYGAGMSFDGTHFKTNGGRLFSVVAKGKDIIEARNIAYGAMANIFIEGNNLHYRTDIGYRDVERILREKYPK